MTSTFEVEGEGEGGAASRSIAANVPSPRSEYTIKDFQASDIFGVLNTHVGESTMAIEHPRLQAFLAFAISPNNWMRMRWDGLMLVVVVLSSLWVPFDAAFRPNKPPGWVSYTMDILFYTDILLNFFTGYDKGYEVVMEKRRIVGHYIKTWFFIDLVATVDWEMFANLFRSGQTTPEWIRMLALIKIFRLLRAGRLIDRLTTTLSIWTGLVDAAKFFLYVSVVAHLLACFFFLWPVLVQWGQDCGQDLEMSNAVRECISGGGDCGGGVNSPTDGIGWYYHGQCRQNGWRQQYNLEEICVPKLCSPHVPGEEFVINYDLEQYVDLGSRCPPGSQFSTSMEMTVDEEQEFLLRCLDTAEKKLPPSDNAHQLCPLCMSPRRLYIDSLYWSLTTMTTIGYGDRGPKNENELYYVLFAEVFGLAFFALLLTQIDRVNEILSKDKQVLKDLKDGVLQFALNRRLPSDLVTDLIRFMNFRATSLSGNAYSDTRHGFDTLSVALRQRIRYEFYLPKLKQICFFGWDDKDDEEENSVRRLFEATDTDNGGTLDKSEIRTLFARLELAMKDSHFDQCWKELDRKETGCVSFDEFSWWWFLTKYGVPRISSGVRCPEIFLERLCERVQPRPFAKGERLVRLGEYGDNFVISLAGRLRIKRPGTRWPEPGSHPDDKDRNTSRDLIINPDDREPIFGFSACLLKSQFDYVKYRTNFWTVDAEDYADTLWVSRKDLFQLFLEYWPAGRKDMVELCYYHYQINLILHGRTEMAM